MYKNTTFFLKSMYFLCKEKAQNKAICFSERDKKLLFISEFGTKRSDLNRGFGQNVVICFHVMDKKQ